MESADLSHFPTASSSTTEKVDVSSTSFETSEQPDSTAFKPKELDPHQPYLQLENIHKSFGKYVALRDIHLEIYPGEFVCLLGPSGCGKTTLLRIIAGLETQTQGRVIQADRDISNLPPSQRDFGIVFQSYALFPNLTAIQNIAYGLQNTKQSKAQVLSRVEELLSLVGLEGLGSKYPAQMSGGQQQRVALARALALSPSLLLLDEPLSALDAQVRIHLRTEISQLQKRLGITTVMVTHDQAEALAMADRIVVMDQGFIAQVGTPRNIYQCPHTPFVANFIGITNFLAGVVTSEETVTWGSLKLLVPDLQMSLNQNVMATIRPEDIQVISETAASTESWVNTLTAQIQSIEFLGSGYRLDLTPEEDCPNSLILDISSQDARQLNLALGVSLRLQLPPEFLCVFPS